LIAVVRDDLGLFAGLKVVGDRCQWQREEFGGYGVADVSDRALAVDEVEYFVGKERAGALNIEQMTRVAA
jgi:hypothetical protein